MLVTNWTVCANLRVCLEIPSKPFFSQSGYSSKCEEDKNLEFDQSSLAFTSPRHGIKDRFEKVLVHCRWVVLSDSDLTRATHSCLTEFQHCSSQPLTCPHSAVVLQCPETPLDWRCLVWLQQSFQYHLEDVPMTVFLTKFLLFCRSLVLGPESFLS